MNCMFIISFTFIFFYLIPFYAVLHAWLRPVSVFYLRQILELDKLTVEGDNYK